MTTATQLPVTDPSRLTRHLRLLLAIVLVGGRLGDRYGKRRMFGIEIAGFTLASLWCGLSADPAMLIAGRLVQGGFGVLLIRQGTGILLASFSREQIPRSAACWPAWCCWPSSPRSTAWPTLFRCSSRPHSG